MQDEFLYQRSATQFSVKLLYACKGSASDMKEKILPSSPICSENRSLYLLVLFCV